MHYQLNTCGFKRFSFKIFRLTFNKLTIDYFVYNIGSSANRHHKTDHSRSPRHGPTRPNINQLSKVYVISLIRSHVIQFRHCFGLLPLFIWFRFIYSFLTFFSSMKKIKKINLQIKFGYRWFWKLDHFIDWNMESEQFLRVVQNLNVKQPCIHHWVK